MTNKIRFTRVSPVDDLTTEIEAHPVSEGRTEVIIEQITYKHIDKRYSPRRLMLFTLSPGERAALIEILKSTAAKAA